MWLLCDCRLAVLRGHRRRVNGCVSDARGQLVLSVGWDFSIKLWSGVTGESQGDLATDRFDDDDDHNNNNNNNNSIGNPGPSQ